jgi:hypothetical protein
MNTEQKRCFYMAGWFAVSGFVVGLVVAGAVISLWSSPLGRNFFVPSSNDLVTARLRFASGVAVMFGMAPVTALIFPRTPPTLCRSLAYLGLSTALCLAHIFLVRAAYAYFDHANIYLDLRPIPHVSDMPLLFVSISPAVVTFLTAALLRILAAYFLPRPRPIHGSA